MAANDTSSNLRLSATSRAASQAADPLVADVIEEEEKDDDCAPSSAGAWVGHADEWNIVFCLDGNSSPLAAIIDKDKMAKWGKLSLVDIIARNAKKWGKVTFLKWAAACTPMQSPNDVGKTHMMGEMHLSMAVLFLTPSCRPSSYQRKR